MNAVSSLTIAAIAIGAMLAPLLSAAQTQPVDPEHRWFEINRFLPPSLDVGPMFHVPGQPGTRHQTYGIRGVNFGYDWDWGSAWHAGNTPPANAAALVGWGRCSGVRIGLKT